MWDQKKPGSYSIWLLRPPKVLLSSALRFPHICLISSFKSSNCRSARSWSTKPHPWCKWPPGWHDIFEVPENPNLNLHVPQLHLRYGAFHGVPQNLDTPPKRCSMQHTLSSTCNSRPRSFRIPHLSNPGASNNTPGPWSKAYVLYIWDLQNTRR